MTRILCLGDSLTYGYGIPRSQVWTALLAARTGMECVNRGVNGTTTGGMLAVMTGELEKLHYDAVILMGGSNDLAYGRDLTGARANMGAMAHIAMSARVCPFIGVPLRPCPPVRLDWSAWADTQEVRMLREEYSCWLKELCGMFRLPVIDFEGEFPRRTESLGGTLREYYLEDGLHPNKAGHELMADIAIREISSALERVSDKN